jgi:hypothetical protein
VAPLDAQPVEHYGAVGRSHTCRTGRVRRHRARNVLIGPRVEWRLPFETRSGNLLGVSHIVEFWPEYNGGPLWSDDGKSVDLAALPLSHDLRSRLMAWNARYDDSKLPFETNDAAWLAEGKALLAETRHAVNDSITVVVTEPWWDEEPSA